jgi:hypothetical protein
MPLTTQAELLQAMNRQQDLQYVKTASATSVAATWCSLFNLAGIPVAGTLSGSVAVVPTSATTGCPSIQPFTGSTGYITTVEHGCSVATRWRLYDMLFKTGTQNVLSTGTLSGQPSYSSRIPNGDYAGTQIWIEAVTAFTGVPAFTVTYTNQSGVTGQTTGGVVAPSALKLANMFQMPLASGDTGVQRIESVACGTATVGTFNVLVLRRLLSGRVVTPDDSGVKGPDLTGLPQVYATSALYVMVAPDSTSTGVPEFVFDVCSG